MPIQKDAFVSGSPISTTVDTFGIGVDRSQLAKHFIKLAA